MSAFIKGFVVMQDKKDGKTPKQISRVFHARNAAEDFKSIAEKTDTQSQYYVADKVGYDKGKESIK